MTTSISSTQYSAGFYEIVSKTKGLILTAAAIGTIAGAAICLTPPYAIASTAFWGAVYLMSSSTSETQKAARSNRQAGKTALSGSIAVHPIRQSVAPQPSSGITQKMQDFSQTGLVYFYNQTNPSTAWLGNFYPISVQFKGMNFRNSEAAFQAQKFIHTPKLMQQFTTLTGDEAFRLAAVNKTLQRSDWAQVNVQIMTDVLRAKMDQHPEIAEWLLATGGAYLVEHNPVKGRDAFWSDDHDGTGQNMLGKIWMRLRSFLGGTGIVLKPAFMSASAVVLAQQTQKTAMHCLELSCSHLRSQGKLFCGASHGRAFKASYIQRKQSGQIDCDYPGCGKPRKQGFDYCEKTHGQIMEDWKRKNRL